MKNNDKRKMIFTDSVTQLYAGKARKVIEDSNQSKSDFADNEN